MISMNKSDIIIGKKVGSLLISKKIVDNRGVNLFQCHCDCGNIINYPIKKITQKRIKSCGCKTLKVNSIHNMSDSIEYISWQSMITRCYNPKSVTYKRYGGRGITVCERWLNSFENFFEDMGIRPHIEYTLDRINNEFGYSPDNCKWSSKREQSLNRGNNTIIEFKGVKKNLSVWAKELGINCGTISSRLKSGWSVQDALTLPIKKTKEKDKCIEFGCENTSAIKNYCKKHYLNNWYKKNKKNGNIIT